MVINQVHVYSFTILETEHDTPVARYAHTPLARPVPLQWMQPKAGGVCATRMRRLLQPKQDAPKPWCQVSG